MQEEQQLIVKMGSMGDLAASVLHSRCARAICEHLAGSMCSNSNHMWQQHPFFPCNDAVLASMESRLHAAACLHLPGLMPGM